MRFSNFIYLTITLAITAFCQGCDSVNDERIPNMPVNISISNAGLWNTYGVAGFGSYRNFTLSPRQPASFPYSSKSATGFGGVLLIEGIDPFLGNTAAPLAYDLACPVERSPEIKVTINSEYMAVCPVCQSIYDVTMQRGAPIGGPAATGKYKYALKTYTCLSSTEGGYFITN
ncbi:MAG: hypothetical protein J1E82_03650 [Muribaculaceae bacterium]|nr:hypothetical protein [Muribaculaceae bacterium]